MNHLTLTGQTIQLSNEDDDIGQLILPPYLRNEEVYTARIIHFDLCEDIGDPIHYVPLIHELRTLTENDHVVLHINTQGGQLRTGVQIINAIRSTPATVTGIIEGEAFSLGSILFLSCDEMIVGDHALMMIHNFRGATSGSGSEMMSLIQSTINWYQQIALDIYIPFISHEEFDNIIKGQDLYLPADEIRNRIEVLEAHRAKEAKEAEENEQQHEQHELFT